MLCDFYGNVLIFKMSLVCCQIREHLEAAFPGFAACFDQLWDRACAWHLVQHFASPQELVAAGLMGLCRSLDAAKVRYQTPTMQRILGIADNLFCGNHHPGWQGRHYILDKLIACHREHETSGPERLRDLEAAVAHLPRSEFQAEAQPLYEELKKIEAGRRRGPQLLGNIVPLVLARLGVGAIPSTPSGEDDPH